MLSASLLCRSPSVSRTSTTTTTTVSLGAPSAAGVTQRRHYTNVYLVAGKRTPFGKFGSALKDFTPNDLATIASKAALNSVAINPSEIDHVVFANVIPSTTDTIYGARHVALKVGAKLETPAYNVNRLCGSGIQAIVDAKFLIQRGEAECVLVTGVENMSMAPHWTYGTRFGSRLEPFKVVDSVMETLTDAYCQTPMAITAENLAEKYSIGRAEVDEFSQGSHRKAAAALGFIKEDLVSVPLKKGTLEADEHVRTDVTIEDMAKLKAVFKKDGVVTAATSSGIVDGAASVVVCSEKFIKDRNITPSSLIGDWSVVGVDPKIMGIGPAPAVQQLLKKTGLHLEDIDLFELNEAFAAQSLAVIKELRLDPTRVNIWGGAIAIGHPLGASGVRIAWTLAQQLKKKQKKVGIATACIGGGQGIALLLKSV